MNSVTQKQQIKGKNIMEEIKTVTQTTLIPTITKMMERLKLSVCLVEHVETKTILQRNVTIRQCSKQATSLEEQTVSTEPTSSTEGTKQYNQKSPLGGPSFNLNVPCVHSAIASDIPETTKPITLSAIHEVVWEQLPEKSMDKLKMIFTKNFATNATTHCPYAGTPTSKMF